MDRSFLFNELKSSVKIFKISSCLSKTINIHIYIPDLLGVYQLFLYYPDLCRKILFLCYVTEDLTILFHSYLHYLDIICIIIIQIFAYYNNLISTNPKNDVYIVITNEI